MGDIDVTAVLKRAAEKSGFIRTRFSDDKLPNTPSDICVMWFFGDMRSACILSSMLLKRYREQLRGSKYFILCTWPGYESMFPYVDEYWSVKDDGELASLYRGACGFSNDHPKVSAHVRQLNYFFEDVVGPDVLEPYYKDGLQQVFWDRLKHVKLFLPSIASIAIMGQGFSKELSSHNKPKVLIYPVRWAQRWFHGKVEWMPVEMMFWQGFVNRLLEADLIPVIYHNFITHDLSQEFLGKCPCTAEKDVAKVLAVMRHVDCVVDVFSGISRLAIAARSPFIYCDERPRYVGLKEYEIDGLCCEKSLPREYIFNFATILRTGSEHLWDVNLFDNIITRCRKVIDDTDRDLLPATSEVNKIVSYADVKRTKMHRLGTKFINVEKD